MHKLLWLMAVIAIIGGHQTAYAGRNVLPADFFLPGVANYDESNVLANDLIKIEDNLYELHQYLPDGKPLDNSSGEFLNFLGFCVAGYISNSQGYSGWSLGMKKVNDGETDKELLRRVLMVGLVGKNKKLPQSIKWIPPISNKPMMEHCGKAVTPKYRW
jgi:hypothetical protein